MLKPYYIQNAIPGKIYELSGRDFIVPPKKDSDGEIRLVRINDNGQEEMIEVNASAYTGIDEMTASIMKTVETEFGFQSREYAFLCERLIHVISSELVTFAMHHWGHDSLEQQRIKDIL